jgi:hypothetical protein
MNAGLRVALSIFLAVGLAAAVLAATVLPYGEKAVPDVFQAPSPTTQGSRNDGPAASTAKETPPDSNVSAPGKNLEQAEARLAASPDVNQTEKGVSQPEAESGTTPPANQSRVAETEKVPPTEELYGRVTDQPKAEDDRPLAPSPISIRPEPLLLLGVALAVGLAAYGLAKGLAPRGVQSVEHPVSGPRIIHPSPHSL